MLHANENSCYIMQIILLCPPLSALNQFVKFQQQQYAVIGSNDKVRSLDYQPDQFQVLATNNPHDPALQIYCQAWENLRKQRRESNRYNESANFLRSLCQVDCTDQKAEMRNRPIPFVTLFIADKTIADRTVTDRTVTDRTVTDRTVTDRTVTDRTIADRTITNRINNEVNSSAENKIANGIKTEIEEEIKSTVGNEAVLLNGLLIGSLDYRSAQYTVSGVELQSLKMQSIGIPESGILCDQQPETVRAIAQYLQRLTQFVEHIELTNFLTTQPLFVPLLQAIQTTGLYTLEPKVHWRAQLLDPQTGDRLQHLSSKRSYNIRSSEKKLAKIDTVALIKLQTEAEIDRFLDQALVIANQTYQSALSGVGVSPHPSFRAYLQELAQQEKIRGYLLQVGETAIAYALGDVCQQQFNFWATSFLPNYRPYSPGLVLIQKVHDDLAAEGVQIFDFGWGEAEYKKALGSECRQEADIRIYAKRWKPLLAYAQDRFLLSLVRSLKSKLKSQGMEQFRTARNQWRQIIMRVRRN
jgi:hypothetical protein